MKVKELIDEFHKEAQPVQEPDELAVAYLSGLYDGKKKRPWVGLTYEEESELIRLAHNHAGIRFYIQAAEAKLKEKNT
jgi:hypothetical protein